MKIIATLIILMLVLPLNAQEREYREKLILMGQLFEFTVVAGEDDEKTAKMVIGKAIDEVRRIDSLFSPWDGDSQAALINRNAGIAPVKVDGEVYRLIERAIAISRMTGGAFDLTYASIDNVWKFDGSMTELPSGEEVAASVSKIGYRKILLNPEDSSVMLKDKGMKVNFGGVGKGYAVDRAREIIRRAGIKSGMINAGGDLYAWGKDAGGIPWRVGVIEPKEKEKVAVWFSVRNTAVVTSGNYDEFIALKGWRFSPVIDPRSGWPVQDIRSVTVICSNTELADGLATAIFVMGRDEGINLVNGLNGVDCLIIDEDGQIWTSKHLALNLDPEGEIHYVVGN